MERTKNALLFVIALCLVLVVLKLYSSGDFVSVAQATMPGGAPATLYGCAAPVPGGTCTNFGWVVVKVTPDGRLWCRN